jgi:signal transduction histidine kinase
MIALKEQFIATASHDFRTPLAVIRMATATLESYIQRLTPEGRIAKLKQINAQVDRMIALLDHVLTLSKANAGKVEFNPTATDLHSFCENVWEDFSIQAEATHSLSFQVDIAITTAIIDVDLLRYVLINLLSNAVKYSPPATEIAFRTTQSQDELIFEVSDTGIGVPAEEQKRLFEPFYRASNTRNIEGTGLGLSIVKTYIETHGGTVDFESEEGRGTTFTLRIPIAVVAFEV